MTAYLDSSAVVKLFVDDEDGEQEVRIALHLLDPVSTSRMTYVETRAALAAARRAGRFGSADHAAAQAEFERVWDEWHIVELTPAVALEAGDVAEAFGLRAGDAVQLASARRLQEDDVMVISWDARLRSAAIASGLACYPSTI